MTATGRKTPAAYARVAGSAGAGARAAGLLRLLAPLAGGALVAGYLLRAAWPRPALSMPAAGAGLLVLALAAAAYLTRARGRWYRFVKGAAGEELVARTLARLPAPYRVYHDVRTGSRRRGAATADHVVLGPSGLFVLETKNWSGRVTVESGRVLYDGKAPRRPPLDQVRAAAAALRENLSGPCGRDVPVRSVLVFASDTLDPPCTGAGGVVVCRQSRLDEVLCDPTDTPLPAGTAALAASELEARTASDWPVFEVSHAPGERSRP